MQACVDAWFAVTTASPNLVCAQTLQGLTRVGKDSYRCPPLTSLARGARATASGVRNNKNKARTRRLSSLSLPLSLSLSCDCRVFASVFVILLSRITDTLVIALCRPRMTSGRHLQNALPLKEGKKEKF